MTAIALGAPAAQTPVCSVLEDVANAESVRAVWSDLARRSLRDELTSSPDWLLTWWKVFGPSQGRRLKLGLFHDGARLIGLAPLLARRHSYRDWLPFDRLELLGSGEPAEEGIYSNHLGLLAERGAEEIVANRLVRALREGQFGTWDEIVLPMMSGDTSMPRLLADAFHTAGIRATITEVARAPYISLPASWDEYLRSLSVQARRNINRSIKAFDCWSEQTTRLENVRGPADLEKGKDILRRLHHARWASCDKTGVFHAPRYVEFHEKMMDRLLETQSLELLWLTAHGEPIAVLYGMVWNGKVWAYQTGRETDLPAHLSPGTVLFALAIKRAIELGRREFDFLADEVFFKTQFAMTSRPLVQVRAVASGWKESLRCTAKAGLAAMAKVRNLGRRR